VGGVINRVTGQPLDALFARLVAAPLGIKHYAMNLTPTGEPYMGGGIHFRPRDFMKFGQLMLNKGVWERKRVLNETWIARATSPLRKLRDIHYGYFWWVSDLPYKGRTVRAFFAGGNGGQVVMAIAELDLVIAFYGGNYGDKVLYVPQRVFVPEFVLPAVEE
jgi:CubicO group peptidase (beta-lactamase class C family)